MLDMDRIAAFRLDGYLLLEGVLDEQEVGALLAAAELGEGLEGTIHASKDGAGRDSVVAIWSELAADIWSAACSHPSIVNTVRTLLGEEVGFYHAKLMFKQARVGGAWEWHQDYGYWYGQFAFPRGMSVFVALDPSTRDNGCLRVLRGSHRLGRLDHVEIGTQSGADPTRLAQVEGLFEHVDCEMAPGSALFFDCNLLHSSAANRSDRDRRALIAAYNALANPQLKQGNSASYVPCPVAEKDALRRFA
jgi:ectoine hydroxylase-related dioxygenase (phytanoyl-CoA dioxygenase family)